MKDVILVGNSLVRIRDFPNGARLDAGFQIDKVQRGESPDDWKPLKTVGNGVKEIRIRGSRGQYRVVYLACLDDEVFVLHAFQKKTQKTRKLDIDLARKSSREMGS